MLVHQMVYHFQNLAGLKYECSWERESLAYAAQEQWLRLHETNLWESFGIDRTIFLLSSEYFAESLLGQAVKRLKTTLRRFARGGLKVLLAFERAGTSK